VSEVSHPGSGQHSPMECSEALLRVFEFLDGEMTPGDQAAISAHLDTCAECLRQYDLDQMVKLVVKRSCQPVSAPASLRATIVHRLTVVQIDTER